ncbi:N-alpha-acetyltransferase 60 isoform X1 [Hippopotamus amphibius kiboko]|uniref:N-alpha-acetyltransferase 60 isoform X1 n=1 Tax=Hippopotamus amphibius kiboko TaxID=575201 RepID=UPI0025975B48|nr:N-alpha-acetyltransferase 60 isoform X1 [Hippopotamus amphibius kiboko]
MTEVVPSSALSEVSLRLLCHDDIDTVKHLCGDWFPIEYPDSWYRDITSNKKFFSLAATYRGAIVGMIVAEIKSRTKIHKEDGDILASSFSVDTQVAYILSLGVVKEFRKHGIGSLLLESLKDHISTTAQDHCKAIYLHVLTTNNTAINFYENRDFKQHHYLPYYYSIRGVLKDGFTYVLYINGGHPPWTILYPFSFGGEGSWPVCQLELWSPSCGILEAKLTGPDVVGGCDQHVLGNDDLGVDTGKADALWLSVLAGRQPGVRGGCSASWPKSHPSFKYGLGASCSRGTGETTVNKTDRSGCSHRALCWRGENKQ